MRVKNAVIIGAGAISIEIAYLMCMQEIKVNIIEILDHILPRALDPDMAKEVEEYIRNKGMELFLNRKVSKIIGKDRVNKVELDSEEIIDADIVISSGGVKPNLELVKDIGLEIGKYGLKVNEYLQTSDPDIYATGDVIEYNSLITNKPILGQLRPNAVIGARIIAKNILGYNVKFPGLINTFATKFFDKCIGGTGITETEAKNEGIDVISVKQSSISKHSMMRGRKPYTVKLIFDRKTEKIIGGQIISDSEAPIKHIDLIGVAIRYGMKIIDLTTLRCAGQPELSPDPGMEPISVAAESAFRKVKNIGE